MVLAKNMVVCPLKIGELLLAKSPATSPACRSECDGFRLWYDRKERSAYVGHGNAERSRVLRMLTTPRERACARVIHNTKVGMFGFPPQYSTDSSLHV